MQFFLCYCCKLQTVRFNKFLFHTRIDRDKNGSGKIQKSPGEIEQRHWGLQDQVDSPGDQAEGEEGRSPQEDPEEQFDSEDCQRQPWARHEKEHREGPAFTGQAARGKVF